MHNPFEPQVEFAGIGKVPYNVLNGEKIKEKFIQFAKKVSDLTKGNRKYNLGTMIHTFIMGK
ncbi:hypothetical protein ABEO83_04125 [Bacillus glycinifermentans]|uniref:hypothetical protein n=1 Tax=Bacillus glycinifermentans TaxID=1664069 RepID=UPI003D1B6578